MLGTRWKDRRWFAPALIAAGALAGLPLGGLGGAGLMAGLAGAGVLARRKVVLRRQFRDLSVTAAALQSRCDEAELRYRHLLDHAGDALFFLDPGDGTLQELNRQAEELLGYSAVEIRSLSLAILFPGRQKHRYLRLVRTVQQDGYGEADDLIFRRKDGSFFTGAVHARLGRLGEQLVLHGVLRDVTERKRMEGELRQRNRDLTLLNAIAHSTATSRNLSEMLQMVLERLVESFAADGGGIYLVRESGTLLRLTAQLGIAGEVFDTLQQVDPKDGLIGRVLASGRPKTSADLQHDRRVRFEVVRRAGWRGFLAIPMTANDQTLGVIFLYRRERYLYQRDAVNLLVAVGRQVGTAVEGTDLFDALQWQNRLTEASNRELERSRRQLGKSLERMADANRTLERLDRMKSQFLDLASHELRTPLTCVLAGSEFLRDHYDDRHDENGRRALTAVIQGGQRLEGVVRDLLEVARLESQSLYLAREPVDMALIFADLAAEFAPLCRQRQLDFLIEGLPAGVLLYGDAFHLRKTFSRLLENAIKFTPSGGRVEATGQLLPKGAGQLSTEHLRPFAPNFFAAPPEGPLLQLTVRDNGVGIDPEEQLRIFDKFYEVGEIAAHFTSSSRFGGKGVGLGLALVKGMVEAHGGMVWVESAGTARPGAGSAFHVLLPVAVSTTLPATTSALLT